MMIIHLRFILTLILTASLISCTTFKTLSPEKTLQDNSRTIKVYLADGRLIKLRAGEYTVQPSSDSGYIEGTGVQSAAGGHHEGQFSGSINKQEINGIQTSEPTWFTTTAGYAVLGILVFGIGYFILISTSLSNI